MKGHWWHLPQFIREWSKNKLQPAGRMRPAKGIRVALNISMHKLNELNTKRKTKVYLLVENWTWRWKPLNRNLNFLPCNRKNKTLFILPCTRLLCQSWSTSVYYYISFRPHLPDYSLSAAMFTESVTHVSSHSFIHYFCLFLAFFFLSTSLSSRPLLLFQLSDDV